jgi:hypothetical protein
MKTELNIPCFFLLLVGRVRGDLPAGCAPGGVIVGFRATPGGDRFSVEGCEDRCKMHPFSKVATDQFTKDRNAAGTITDQEIDQALDESDFLLVSGWQGFKTNLHRFPAGSPADTKAGADQGRKMAPTGKVLVSRHMDPRHLAGKMLFENAPFINISMVSCLVFVALISVSLH